MLRAKNIGSFGLERQVSLFSGRFRTDKSDPVPTGPAFTCGASRHSNAYFSVTGASRNPEQLFKIVFWTLTAKVFPRQARAGLCVASADPDELWAAVAVSTKRTPRAP